jgi:hypothetical protein
MDIVLQVVATILPIGVFYGATNARIRALEKHIDNIGNILDRLARIEEKINVFLEIRNLK